ncbi:hypothetical protein D3C76_837610 [compost metagenome]
MAETQLALHQLAITGLALDLARAVVIVGVFGMQEDFPEVFAHLVQFGAVVTQGLAQMVVAVDHALADHILHIQMIRHGAHHVRPEPFALLQRQLDELATGDVSDAQDHCIIVVRGLRQAQHQPQVLDAAAGVLQLDFQLKLLLLVEHRVEHLVADGGAVLRITVDQQFPGLVGAIDIKQLQRHLVDLGDPQFLEQWPALLRDRQPRLQLLTALQLCLVEKDLEPGHIEDAQGHAGAFENVLVTPAAFIQLALTPARVQQGEERQHGKRQAQQTFADERRQQLFQHALTVEQAAQLPIAAAQRNRQHAVGDIVVGQRARVDRGQRFVATDDLMIDAVLHQPQRAAAGLALLGQGRKEGGRQAQDPIASGTAAGLMQQ